jgi:hypothetical protein
MFIKSFFTILRENKMSALFREGRSGDEFNPEYGGINWKRRLNKALEDTEITLEPMEYVEPDKEPMQVTQENTVIFINQIADELDCITVNYTPDGDLWTWYFREKFKDDETFMRTVNVIGQWATQIITIYPRPEVVQQYEAFHDSSIPAEIPLDWFSDGSNT